MPAWFTNMPIWALAFFNFGITCFLVLTYKAAQELHSRYLELKWGAVDARKEIKEKDDAIAQLQKENAAALEWLKSQGPVKDGGYRKEKDGG